jgi:hypothetical protein
MSATWMELHLGQTKVLWSVLRWADATARQLAWQMVQQLGETWDGALAQKLEISLVQTLGLMRAKSSALRTATLSARPLELALASVSGIH